MRSTREWLFVAWLVLVGAFILVTGAALPGRVASHFAASGEPDSFMPRGAYLAVMCVCASALPLVMVFAQRRIARRSPQRLNLPNREYWLAPQRRDGTLQAIEWHMMGFGAGLSLLLAFAHWEVVQANLRTPPLLDSVRLLTGIGLFVLATAWWVYRLFARFRRP